MTCNTGARQRPSKRKRRPRPPGIACRSETEADVSAIGRVTVAAFKALRFSDHNEQLIIQALRACKALTISLVAELEGRIIGHVAFSPVIVSDGAGGWYGLGPLSVVPTHQRQGIGTMLVQEGLSRLRALKARGCCLVGHPDYYRRFGFRNVAGLVYDGAPPAVCFALSFDGHYPRGTVTFHQAFMQQANPDT